jgi:hypothetical protein
VDPAVVASLRRQKSLNLLLSGLKGFGLEALGNDAWFRAKVQDALDDIRPPLAHDDVEDYFAKKRAKLTAQSDVK